MTGWIKLYRKVQNHWLYKEKRIFSKYEAWLDLLMMANHKEVKFVFGNELIEVKKGQFITSIRKLGEKWRWSNRKVTQYLKLLEMDEMIHRESDTKKTVITIVNYEVYHEYRNTEETENRHETDTKQTRTHTNKKDQELKKKIKEDMLAEIENLKESFSPGTRGLIDPYWEVIKRTRKSNTVQPSVILKMMKQWLKYDDSVIQYALKKHIQSYDTGKYKEYYTIGIMRNTTPEEAAEHIDSKVVEFRSKNEPARRATEYIDLSEYMGEIKRE